MRATATPTIQFGLLSIPIRAYLACESKHLSFNMITPAGSRVRQKNFDAVSGEEVERSKCLKGFEYEKGKFITFTEKDIDTFCGEQGQTIELDGFTTQPFAPHRIEKTYYLTPGSKGAEKAYRLLAATLKDGLVAYGKWFSRGKDNLIVLGSDGKHLRMYQIYYADEVRPFDYKFSETSVPSDKELLLANLLVSKLNNKFNDADYKDEFIERVQAAIDLKLSLKDVKEGQKKTTESVKKSMQDLVAILEASLSRGEVPTPIDSVALKKQKKAPKKEQEV